MSLLSLAQASGSASSQQLCSPRPQSPMCMQLICESARPGVPMCALATSGEQLTKAQGLDSPSNSPMHQLWVCSCGLIRVTSGLHLASYRPTCSGMLDSRILWFSMALADHKFAGYILHSTASCVVRASTAQHSTAHEQCRPIGDNIAHAHQLVQQSAKIASCYAAPAQRGRNLQL